MSRTHTRTKWQELALLSFTLLALNGCAALKNSFQPPTVPDSEIECSSFRLEKGNDVVGHLASVTLKEGDTLPDIARHFGLGINALSAANPGVDIWVPEAGRRIILPLSFILPDTPRNGIVINLAAMRLFKYSEEPSAATVSTYPVGIGTGERPTPQGPTRIVRKATRPTWYVPAKIANDHLKKGDPLPAKVPPGPLNPLGEYALYLGKSGYLIHGTNKPASIGLKASNGCLRLYPENVKTLFSETRVNTPVLIIDQPYLIGQRNGVLYLQAHTPRENPAAGVAELARINDRLKRIEKQAGRRIDWEKVRTVQTEARGIPVALLALQPDRENLADRIIEVEHPQRLFAQPQPPQLKQDAWYVLAGETADEIEARRTAAIINHQGPPIPARVIQKGKGYRIIAGPFSNSAEAGNAARRLKIDLEIDGILIEPDRKASAQS